MLKVSLHAAERFLQRVFEMSDYTKQEIINATKLFKKIPSMFIIEIKTSFYPLFPIF